MYTRCVRSLATALTAVLTAVALLVAPAIGLAASSDATEYDTAGNATLVEETASASGVTTDDRRDVYAVGNVVALRDAKVGGDVLGAGRSVLVSNSAIAGSIRMAGAEILLDDITAANLNLAADTIEVTQSTKVAGAYIAARELRFAGEAESLSASADTVYLEGRIDGDAEIYASRVVIGKHAEVSGTLRVHAEAMPEVPSTAKIGNLSYTADSASTWRVSWNGMQYVELDSTRARIFATIFSAVVMLVCALLLSLLLRGAVENSARMVRVRPVPVILTGLVCTLLGWLVALLLLAPIVTAPIALAALLMLCVTGLICVPFTAASLSRLALPNMHRGWTSILFGLIFGALLVVPILGFVIIFFSFVYMLGYLVQLAFLGMTGRTGEEIDAQPRRLPSDEPVLGSSYTPGVGAEAASATASAAQLADEFTSPFASSAAEETSNTLASDDANTHDDASDVDDADEADEVADADDYTPAHFARFDAASDSDSTDDALNEDAGDDESASSEDTE